MLGGKVLHDQRKMFIAYLSAALLIVLLITAVMYANTTALVRRQHRESAQETARAQQRLLDRVFLELIMIAQQVEGDAELSDYYVSSAGYGAYQGMTSLRRYLVTNDYLLDVGLLFSDGHLLTAQGSYSLAGYADRFNLPQIQQVYDTWVSERGQTRYRLYAAPQGRALIVAFTQPLIGNPKTRQIVFTLSEKQIDSLFAAAMQDAGSDLALYDREGTLLYHYRDGEPPLARAKDWHTDEGYPYELSTMPGFAGSSAYYLRYMDPHNDKELVSKEADEYWRNVDLYVGGIEHATGHLMYSRFWNMFLYDIGCVCEPEPFKKLINQGMIQGRSNFVYRIKGTNKYVSAGLKDGYDTQEIHVDVNIVRNDVLDLDAFRKWMPEYADAEFVLEDGKYVCGWAIEKMSKSMYNVVNPDHIVRDYGADTLRMYEMFLGPLEQSKPWDTNGIDGVHKFLRRFWRLFFDRDGKLILTDEKPTAGELKTLHKTIRKVTEDIENFSFNTSVSAFMICLNELSNQKCAKRAVLEPLVVLIAPFAPHLAEEVWEQLGHGTSVFDARFPEYDEKYLVEDSFEYPVSFNGKMRFKKELSLSLSPKEVEAAVLADPAAGKYLEGKTPKKVVVVPGKIVNVVC